MPVIIGTGGHVDHGKTLLVSRLTGHPEDLDRWAEEKKRGLTIDLGFAFLKSDQGDRISFVDVPGHEAFINNMVVGAAGIDAGLLVVAADDSVMPQTVEHLEIMDLLGIRDYIAAVSKIDIVEEEMTELVIEEIEELFSDHPECTLHSIVKTSAAENRGIGKLKDAVVSLCSSLAPEKSDRGFFRLPVDRVFTVKGFGTVVTGSLVSGRVRTGEDAEIVPSGINVRVRGIEVDDSAVDEAVRGERTALNISGADTSSVSRGDQVVCPGSVTPSYMVNAEIHPAVSLREPVENRRDVRFMSGTGETAARMEILNEKTIKPGGGSCLAQFRFRKAVPLKILDRFIIRELSPQITLGGGTVLETSAAKLTGRKTGDIERLKRLVNAPLSLRVEEFVRRNRHSFSTVRDAAFEHNCPPEEIRKVMEEEIFSSLCRTDSGFIHQESADLYADSIRSALSAFHNSHPYDPGADVTDILNSLPRYFNPDIADAVLKTMTDEGSIVLRNGTYSIQGFSVSISDEESRTADSILETLSSAEKRYAPPSKDEMGSGYSQTETFENAWQYLIKSGKLVKVAPGIVFSRTALDEIREMVQQHILKQQSIEASELRDRLGNSRKY